MCEGEEKRINRLKKHFSQSPFKSKEPQQEGRERQQKEVQLGKRRNEQVIHVNRHVFCRSCEMNYSIIYCTNNINFSSATWQLILILSLVISLGQRRRQSQCQRKRRYRQRHRHRKNRRRCPT